MKFIEREFTMKHRAVSSLLLFIFLTETLQLANTRVARHAVLEDSDVTASRERLHVDQEQEQEEEAENHYGVVDGSFDPVPPKCDSCAKRALTQAELDEIHLNLLRRRILDGIDLREAPQVNPGHRRKFFENEEAFLMYSHLLNEDEQVRPVRSSHHDISRRPFTAQGGLSQNLSFKAHDR